MKINVNKNIFNSIYLSDVTDYSKRHQVFYGSAGSGKSHYIAQKLLIKSLKSKRKVLILRKVDKTTKDSTWSMMLDIIDQFNLTDHVDIQLANMKIVLPNGSEMLFRGLQDPERIKSITKITDAWMEEASEFTAEDADQIDLRVRTLVPNLQIYYSYNPVSKANWVYERWHKQGVEIPDDTVIYKTTYRDNKFLPESYRQTMENLKKRDPTMYKVYALGEFASLGKKVYDNWEEKFLPIEEVKDWDTYLGLDFGYTNDPSAFIAVKVNLEEKKMYIFDEFQQKGMMNDTIADMIKAKGYAKDVITADSAEQKSIAEIKREGIYRIRPAKKGPDSVRYGIEKIKQFEIIVSPECRGTIEELKNYMWKKDRSTGEYINEPVDDYNHLLDALRYAVEDVGEKRKATTFSKGLLGL